MDEQKRSLIPTIVLALGLAGYFFFVQRNAPAETPGDTTSASGGGGSATVLADGVQRARRASETRVSVQTPELEATFTDRNAGLVSLRLKEPRFSVRENGRTTQEDLVSTDREEFLPLRQSIRGVAIPLDATWQAEQVDPQTVRFTWVGDGFRVVRTVKPGSARYVLESETTIENLSRGPRPVRVVEHVYRYVARDDEGGGFFGSRSPAITEGLCEARDGKIREHREKLEDARGLGPDVRFASWGSNYFTMALAPASGTAQRCVVGVENVVVPGEDPLGSVFSVDLGYARRSVPAGGSVSFRTVAYLGPKDPAALTAAGHSFEDAIDLGMFGFIARGMVWLLRTIYAQIGNWGIAIILLTVFVRLVLYPLTASSLASMSKMRMLKPELDRIQELYGDDQEKKGAAMMALYKTHSINPFAGCLPALAQMPIWLALYTSLSTNVELYHASFLVWGDLSAPDPWKVLPLALAGLMFVQQKMTPTTMDPMQAKIMLYLMPIMMGMFMLFLPAGLCVYMLTNSTLGIVQQRFIQWRLDRVPVATATNTTASIEETAAPVEGGASSSKKGSKRGRA